jgi:glutamate-ammonia-ligase adenylyltransferase
VAGDPGLGADLEDRAGEICWQERRADQIWSRLCHLRQRMERERSQERGGSLDLKLGFGGIADLEFIAQGGQLLHGHALKELRVRDGAQALDRILREMGWAAETRSSLRTCFVAYQALLQRLQLVTNQGSSKISRSQLRELRSLGLWPIAEIGHGMETWADLIRMRRRVRHVWTAICGPYQEAT